MDQPLSSDRGDRRDYSSSLGHYGPGGHAAGGGYRGSRGGRGQRGRGGPRSPYHHPYRRGGGGGPRRAGNRFAADHPQERDPRQAVIQQTLQLLQKLGELKPIEDTDTSSQRALVATQAKNVQGLTDVLCGSNAQVFLQFEAPSTEVGALRYADKEAGPLAAGIVHSVAVGPFQAPCYVALTLAVNENAPANFAGFASRCVEYTTRRLARDLDSLLLPNVKRDDTHLTILRIKLLLRYLALLASVNILQIQDGNDPVPAATNQNPVSLMGLLESLVQAAIVARNRHSNNSVALVLTLITLSTIPYLQSIVSVEVINDKLIEPLEPILASYFSTFTPGIGPNAMLLKEEQVEDIGQEDEEAEEEDEEEEEEEEDLSNQVCDTFQDLVRSIKQGLNKGIAGSRFALFSDAPWKSLSAPIPRTEESLGEGEMEDNVDGSSQKEPLKYTGEPLSLNIFPECVSLTKLLGVEASYETKLANVRLEGTLFGRLPIFGPPPEAREDDDMMEEGAPSNERMEAYKTSFGMLDRYFLGEAVRDCLASYESYITDTGVEKGNTKLVAEHIWSLSHMFTGQDTKGIEYAILESIFSLIVQCSNTSVLRLMYLSRVLLDLTRIEPNIMSPVIALGISYIFQDYMPALVPEARYNLSKWFAFHMTNTDYQWPSAYWKHWEPYVLYGWNNSRGAFVRNAIAAMSENVSDPSILVRYCFPQESILKEHVLVTLPGEDIFSRSSMLVSLAHNVESKIWNDNEDAATLLSYLVGDEVSESSAAESHSWGNIPWRTSVVLRALLNPALKEYIALNESIKKASGTDGHELEVAMSIEGGDVLSSILDYLSRYQSLLEGVLAKDIDTQIQHGTISDQDDPLSKYEIFMLDQINKSTGYSQSLLLACIQTLLCCRIIRPLNILKWAMGDYAGSSGKHRFSPRLCELAQIAIDIGLEVFLASSIKAVADSADMNDKKIEGVLNFIEPLLSYVVRRGCDILLAMENEVKGYKFTPIQVDIVEGVKYLVRESHAVCRSASRAIDNLHTTSYEDFEENLKESEVSAARLASYCKSSSGNTAIECMKRSLENLHKYSL